MAKEKASGGPGLEYHKIRAARRRRRWMIVVALLLATGGYYYFTQMREEVVEDQPLIAVVEYGNIENAIAAAGSLQPKRVVDVGARVSGQLQKLYVEIGDMVEQGQLLAEIDAREQELRLESTLASIEGQEAQIASREASLKLAEDNARRQDALHAAGAASQQEYDSAMNNLASAIASLTQLRKQIEQSKASYQQEVVQLEYTKIDAPIAGTVVDILQDEGVTLNATQQAPTILQIADLSTMTVETQISEADIGRIETGMEVYFTTLGGGERRWYSTLRQRQPTPVTENNVVLYTGLFDIDNEDGSLFPGMTTQVFFVTSSAHNVLTVPVGALTFTDMPARGGMGNNVAGRMAGQNGPGGSAAGAAAGRGGAGRGGAGRGGIARGDFPGGEFPRDFAGGDFRGLAGRGQGGGAAGAMGRSGGQSPDAESMGPRNATVQLVREDGTFETKEVIVGVMSRVDAEVISGLKAGDRVVAGIVQAQVEPENSNNNNNNNNWRGGGMPRGMFF